MSLFNRGLNLITGSISQMKKSNSAEQKRREHELEKELLSPAKFVPKKKEEEIPSSPDLEESKTSDQEPFEPKKRTI
jgi:hypothetical protein